MLYFSKHPLCRDLRLKLLTLGFTILGCTNLEAGLEQTFRSKLYQAALSWFEEPPTCVNDCCQHACVLTSFNPHLSWSYGSDRLQMAEDARALQKIIQTVQIDQTLPRVHFSTRTSAFRPGGGKSSFDTPGSPLTERFPSARSKRQGSAAAAAPYSAPRKRASTLDGLEQSLVGSEKGKRSQQPGCKITVRSEKSTAAHLRSCDTDVY